MNILIAEGFLFLKSKRWIVFCSLVVCICLLNVSVEMRNILFQYNYKIALLPPIVLIVYSYSDDYIAGIKKNSFHCPLFTLFFMKLAFIWILWIEELKVLRDLGLVEISPIMGISMGIIILTFTWLLLFLIRIRTIVYICLFIIIGKLYVTDLFHVNVLMIYILMEVSLLLLIYFIIHYRRRLE